MIPLIIMDAIIIDDMNIINFMLYISRTIGAIFCHVKISRQFSQFNPSITSGNQKWNGAIPIFVRSAVFIHINSVEFTLSLLQRFFSIIIAIIEARIIVDAIA